MAFGYWPNFNDQFRELDRTRSDGRIGPFCPCAFQELPVEHKDVVRFQSLPLPVLSKPRAIGYLGVQPAGEQREIADGMDEAVAIGFGT